MFICGNLSSSGRQGNSDLIENKKSSQEYLEYYCEFVME